MTQEAAQIFDRGYRRYTGRRTGLPGALKSLVRFSVFDALGIGRSIWMKVVPVIMIAFAYLPAIAFVGLAAILPEDLREEGILPTYASYYGYVVAAIYIFAAFIGPLLLCTDRRTGMLGVYLASPLDRPNYLFGKALATFSLIMVVTLGPPLLMLIAFTLENAGPDGFVNWIETLTKIVLSSAVMGMMFAAVSLAIAATTDRALIATAAIALIIPGSAIISDTLVSLAGFSPTLHLLNLPGLPRELIFRIHGEANRSFSSPTGDGSLWTKSQVSTTALWLAWLGYLVASGSFIWFRYRRLLVRR